MLCNTRTYIVHVTVRLSLKEIELIEEIRKIRSVSRSQVIREAIHLYYSLIKNSNNTNNFVGGIVIQNPVINIVTSESRNEVNVDLSELTKIITRLYRLRDPLPPLQRQLVEKMYKIVEKVMTK